MAGESSTTRPCAGPDARVASPHPAGGSEVADRLKRLAPLSGVLMVALLVVLFALPSTPDSTASGASVISWYRNHHTQVYVQAALVSYAGALAVLYFTSVARFLRRRGADMLATTTVVGGAIAAAGLLIAGGAAVAANDGPQRFTADEARALNVLQNNLFVPVLLGGIAIATLSMGVAMLRTKALPQAVGIITTVVGVVAISGIVSWIGFLASGPLTLLIAGYVYARSGDDAVRPTQITLPPDMPEQRATTDAQTKATTA